VVCAALQQMDVQQEQLIIQAFHLQCRGNTVPQGCVRAAAKRRTPTSTFCITMADDALWLCRQ
jgi:hypothetical protein